MQFIPRRGGPQAQAQGQGRGRPGFSNGRFTIDEIYWRDRGRGRPHINKGNHVVRCTCSEVHSYEYIKQPLAPMQLELIW